MINISNQPVCMYRIDDVIYSEDEKFLLKKEGSTPYAVFFPNNTQYVKQLDKNYYLTSSLQPVNINDVFMRFNYLEDFEKDEYKYDYYIIDPAYAVVVKNTPFYENNFLIPDNLVRDKDGNIVGSIRLLKI